MADSAKGPSAGYIYQFEIALLQLAKLELDTDYISIEDVDDVASHKADGTVLITVQAKHSIVRSGSTFQDTSYSLWRTIQIWIEKIQKGVFDDKTEFHCSTNKKIASDTLLYKLCNNTDPDKSIEEIKELLRNQKEKLKAKTDSDPTEGKHIQRVIQLIEFVLKNETDFRRVLKSIKIQEVKEEKALFLSALQLGTDKITENQKDNIYHTFLGWIVESSIDKWRQESEARFTKKALADKWYYVRETPSIAKVIFRQRSLYENASSERIEEIKQNLFVKQIEDIKRNNDSKQRIIQKAINDYIYSDIEIAHIVKQGVFTNKDFEDFNAQCRDVWQNYFDQVVHKEIEEYTEEEINDIAKDIYDHIIGKIQMRFNETIEFTMHNEYVKNGSFLRLSDKPIIGWRPDWQSKYLSE